MDEALHSKRVGMTFRRSRFAQARLAELNTPSASLVCESNGGPHVVRLGRARGRDTSRWVWGWTHGKIYMFVVVESEEAARAGENDPRRREGLQAARATMAEASSTAPGFVDLTVSGSSRPGRMRVGSTCLFPPPACSVGYMPGQEGGVGVSRGRHIAVDRGFVAVESERCG